MTAFQFLIPWMSLFVFAIHTLCGLSIFIILDPLKGSFSFTDPSFLVVFLLRYRDFLPRGSGIVTRRPLVLQLMTCPTGRNVGRTNICRVSYFPGWVDSERWFKGCCKKCILKEDFNSVVVGLTELDYNMPMHWFNHLQQSLHPSITLIVLVLYLKMWMA